jgi:colanic acid/amylovoran biosynthesis protein
MTIEIAGSGFLNKGAELMLRTVVARFRSQNPNIRMAVPPGADSCFEQRAELGLACMFPSASLFSPSLRKMMLRYAMLDSLISKPLSMLMPSSADRLLGLVQRGNCDALIDISGYAYGDKFAWGKCRAAATRSRSYAKRGKPIIYLPQMFGPFTNPKVIKYFKRCCDESTRIYAREQASYDAVRQLIGDDDRLRMAPDITIFSSASVAHNNIHEAYACLVPNEKLLVQSQTDWINCYLSRMIAAGVRMHERGVLPAVVSHSAESQDAALAKELADGIEETIGKNQVIRFSELDPYALKSFIAGSRYLVGSRFHSVVAALSSGVPAVSLGWAHKYDMLAKDFGIAELQHHAAEPIDHLLSLVDTLSDHVVNQDYRQKIVKQRELMQANAEAMWTDVFSLLGLSN